MSPKDNLLRIIEKLPAEKLVELERIAASMLSEEAIVLGPGPARTFEEAVAATFKKFDEALRKLSD